MKRIWFTIVKLNHQLNYPYFHLYNYIINLNMLNNNCLYIYIYICNIYNINTYINFLNYKYINLLIIATILMGSNK